MGILRTIRKYWHIYIILFFVIVLGIRNFTSGTYLAGWDNLQTELAPTLAIKRAFFSVWQEYQSFGLIAGMAHAADLPRALFGFILSIFVPQEIIRYISQLIYILIGALGALFLFMNYLDNHKYKKLYSVFGALLYIINIGSIQILSLPFETFSLFFAFLPWLIFAIFTLLDIKKTLSKKHILLFLVLQFLASSFAVSQQLFVVYGLIITVIFFCSFLRSPTKQSFVRIIILGCLVLVCNLYWVLPQIEFLKTNGSVVQNSKINQLSTEDIYYRNLEKGTLDNFFFIKNFFLDTVDKKNTPMLLPWLQWYEFPWTKTALTLITGISLLGFFSRKRHTLEFKLLYGLFAVLLLANTPLFSSINTFIRSNSFINQIFRSPFTKFVVPYSLIYSFLFVEGLGISENVLKYVFKNKSVFVIGVFMSLSISILAYPAIDGYLYPKELKVAIPTSYANAISHFKSIDVNRRIALLPEYTYWGWFFNTWGYNGSGFLWYGIEQPIISRTFDVWSRESENYYWEIKQAIESENPSLFQNVANKYNVSYFLLDKSLLPITSSAKGMQYDRLEKLLPQIPGMKKIQKWGNLELYENIYQSQINNFITASTSAPAIGPIIRQTNLDTAFEASGGYITKNNLSENDIVYPFLNLMTQTRQNNPDWNIAENNSEFIITSLLNIDISKYDVIVPKTKFSQILFTEKGVASSSGSIFSLINTSGNIEIRIPKIHLRAFNPADTEVTNCGNANGQLSTDGQDSLHITTNNQANACFGYTDATLDQTYGYLTSLQSEKYMGRGLLFYILDLTKKESVVEERLKNTDKYFIIPPRDRHGLGYNFSFQQNSYIDIPSENKLSRLEIYAFPVSEIKNIYLRKKNTPTGSLSVQVNHNSTKISYYSYHVSIENNSIDNGLLSLNQSFHDGWKAYEMPDDGKLNWMQENLPFFFGTEIKEHVLVNNWANGWELKSLKVAKSEGLKSETNVVIVFWPQYLEYLGFVLLGGAFLGILFWKENKPL